MRHICAAMMIVGIGSGWYAAPAVAAPDRCRTAPETPGSTLPGSLTIADNRLAFDLGDIEFDGIPGLLSAKTTGCGFALRGGSGPGSVRFGMASVLADEYLDQRATRPPEQQIERVDANILHNSRASWQVSATALQSFDAEADQPDWNSALASRVMLFDGRITTSSNIAWIDAGEQDDSERGKAHRHSLQAAVIRGPGWSLTSNAGFRYADRNAAGPAQQQLEADRSGGNLGLVLSLPRVELGFSTSRQRDNLDGTADETNLWTGWQGRARLEFGEPGKPRRLSGTVRQRSQKRKGSADTVQEETAATMRMNWGNGIALAVAGGSQTLFEAGVPSATARQMMLAGERDVDWAAWRLRTRAVLERHWGESEIPDDLLSVSIELQASRTFANGIEIDLGSNLRQVAVADAGGELEAALRLDANLRF